MSIKVFGDKFLLTGRDSSYLLGINREKHLVLLHYGSLLKDEREFPSFSSRPINPMGTSLYRNNDPLAMPEKENSEFILPFSGVLSKPSLEIYRENEGSSYDFVYQGYEIKEASRFDESLPFPHGAGEELVIELTEKRINVSIYLHYLMYAENDMLCRYMEIRNDDAKELIVCRAASSSLSLQNDDYFLSSFHGAWANELHEERRKLSLGTTLLYSDSGSSSNRIAPFFSLYKDEEKGSSYGFSLLYSGSFETTIDLDISGKIRINQGISGLMFEKRLASGESFVTPLAMMSFSDKGRRGLSQNFASFTKECLLPPYHATKSRPIAYNSWESVGFKFNEHSLHSLIDKAAKLGMELFVLDDGWFGKRNDDASSLGDWSVNKKKIPHGLEGLLSYAKKKGMSFGIWMEPEMVSFDSELYKAHPDWVLKDTAGESLVGRNQYLLDLRKKEVQDYVIDNVSNILSIPGVSYLKWDYNRPFGDIPLTNGTCHYDYMRGLYRVLGEIRKRFPETLMENCASGGNRFDHGMMTYFDQSWLSDCTDSFERIRIQRGASYFFPPVVFSNHVSSKTNNQTMRLTSLENKFDVASFGVLGYELNLDDLSSLEEKTIKRQISFYKEHRDLFEFGSFYRLSRLDEDRFERWEIVNKDKAIIANFDGIIDLNGATRRLSGIGFDDDSLYEVKSRECTHSLLKFGPLVNYVSPVHLKEEGAVINALAKKKGIEGEKFERTVSGKILNGTGLPLPELWKGTGMNEGTCVLGDFGTRMYLIKPLSDPSDE